MPALTELHFTFPILTMAFLVAAVLVIALCTKPYVKTGVRLRSFDFFLEAGGDHRKRGEKKPILKG
jgi:hypothetical protein